MFFLRYFLGCEFLSLNGFEFLNNETKGSMNIEKLSSKLNKISNMNYHCKFIYFIGKK